MIEDFQLLRDYAENRSEQAFAELVKRHVNFVYSTALRVVGERSLAEDVTQMVFIRLARKAGSLRKAVILSGWLYRTTQFVGQTVRRSEARRRNREALAMQLSEFNRNTDSVWKDISPLLEEAMAHLRQTDQDAVLLRFFAEKSLREVGQALGVSDDSAQKRVNRALERMRDFFARRGVGMPTALLGLTLAAHTVQAAPAHLASFVVTSVAGGMGASLGFTTTFKLFQTMIIAKLKAHAVGASIAALFLVGGASALVQLAAQTATTPPQSDLSNSPFVLRGRLQKPDGKPLSNAKVHVATIGGMVRLYYLTNALPATARISKVSTTSREDGTFAVGLPAVPPQGKAVVAVNDDAGYAVATAEDLAANPNVIVQPWGRIEGVLKIGKAIGSNQMVNIGIWGTSETYEWNIVSHDMSVKTDANGRFIFPRVAPGDVWLTHSVAVRPGDGRQSGHHYVKVEPGDRLEVMLGGTGRLVTGRIQTDLPTNLVFYGSMWANETHGMRNARNWRSMSDEEKRLFTREWRNSPQSDTFKQEVRNYEFPVQRDGTFRVPDVLPARYRMQIRADAPREPGKPGR
ncbi:MAG TPA: sigma-70 family RNA polymerase sigma factor, partial [Candidatus Saccharimonadales bacterium]|nr:sigma-70 family RNA polymerase sigma factor [Candidatus Saccharimonadales bacterium]